jgi:hypothetical protein
MALMALIELARLRPNQSALQPHATIRVPRPISLRADASAIRSDACRTLSVDSERNNSSTGENRIWGE